MGVCSFSHEKTAAFPRKSKIESRKSHPRKSPARTETFESGKPVKIRFFKLKKRNMPFLISSFHYFRFLSSLYVESIQTIHTMAVNGFLTRLFKSDKDKKSKSKNNGSNESTHHSQNRGTSANSSNHSIVSSPNNSRANSQLSTATNSSSSDKLENTAVPMSSAASSASIIHPVDSHHLPHLKLNRFLEKRHIRHHEFNELHDITHSIKQFNNSHANKSSSSLYGKNGTPQPQKSTSSKNNHGVKESKFDDFNALVKLVSKYGIVPNDSVDLMHLLKVTDAQAEKSTHDNGTKEVLDGPKASEASEASEAPTSIKSSKSSKTLEKLEILDVPEAKDASNALIIGKGAGGSVYPLYDSNHNHLYAMKKLRLQQTRENWTIYETKLQNEFKIANKLHNQNVIRTYDLLQDNDLFIIVMDYAPYDFFTMVMAGILSKHEIYCYFKQMCKGVHYMHSLGLAHRDLKLDNCVVDKNGILKIVDFGSSVIFDIKRYTNKGESSTIERASGILGSDPYLAPEVVSYPYYDPSLADVWSLAIIYCCMVLRRFPWRLPKTSDVSYNYFISKPGEITDKNGNKKIVGPDRLLRLLPSSSKHLIDHMLKINPNERYDMDKVMESHFIQKIKECHYEEYNSDRNQGIFVASEDHTHHLITNKEFSEKNPEEVKLEKEREEKQAKEILAQNAMQKI